MSKFSRFLGSSKPIKLEFSRWLQIRMLGCETLSNQTFHQNHQNIKFFSIFKIPFLIRLGGAHDIVMALSYWTGWFRNTRLSEKSNFSDNRLGPIWPLNRIIIYWNFRCFFDFSPLQVNLWPWPYHQNDRRKKENLLIYKPKKCRFSIK